MVYRQLARHLLLCAGLRYHFCALLAAHAVTPKHQKPVALTVAGSDPGGGAGIQADLKTFAALGVYGTSALTAVIAQNSFEVARLEPVGPAMVAAQIETLVRERRPDAIKIGALGNAAVVRAVARAIVTLDLPAPVVDPVLVSSSGTRLIDRRGERALAEHLFPLARVVTPNLQEAAALTHIAVGGERKAMRAAARELYLMGARAVVIKGGHAAGRGPVIDLFYEGNSFIELRGARVAGRGAHGTGCAFSAAIAAMLARGMALEAAVRAAKSYVSDALRGSFRLAAKGRPLLDHFARTR
jgi:hydroxymethylpyrimidine/phosphomethylpyrimidine kinase